MFDGESFVTSPNPDVVYAPPTSGRMTYKQDYRLGYHDPLLWPQPFFPDYCHLVAISRAPETLDEDTSTHILFHKAADDDFVLDDGSTLRTWNPDNLYVSRKWLPTYGKRLPPTSMMTPFHTKHLFSTTSWHPLH